MGESKVEPFDPKLHQAFVRALLNDVQALEYMHTHQLFETGKRRIGAEQEMFLIDSAGSAAPMAEQLLADINDPDFTHELARFNLEANLPPYDFGGDCLGQMEARLRAMLQSAQRAARGRGGDVLLVGILPTLQKSDLSLDNMYPVQRYRTLNDALIRQTKGGFQVSIEGIDELELTHHNVMLEACNTSFQVHFQVGPDEFAKLYNVAQAVTAPVLAAAVNSPVLLGRRLWHETRLALFQRSIDDRSEAHRARGQRPRVRFGEAWIKDSVLEIFRDDIARFRVVVSSDPEPNPLELLKNGGIPNLAALRLHNGTVYRWNRPCYGIHNGVPHLRIENRVLPAGPTVLDEMANAAFFFGLMAAVSDAYGDIRDVMLFDDAKDNFMAAAKFGLQAQFKWIGGRTATAAELIIDELLPLARTGLESRGIDGADIERYLGTLEARTKSGQTGARWALDSLKNMSPTTKVHQRMRSLTEAMRKNQNTGEPVHTWPMATDGEAADWRYTFQTVERCMNDDLFTVGPDELIDLVANLMDWEHLRYVPVEDGDGQLVGLVSYRALLRVMARGAKVTSVSEIMRTDVQTVTPSTPTLEAIEMMRRYKIGCLPVVQDNTLVGVVTESDLLAVAARLIEEQLRAI